MLLNSVVIVLREVLEAALLISVFMATSRNLGLSNRWAAIALVLGGIGAVVYGYLLGPVSELFDGVGQEVSNASLQLGAFLMLVPTAFQIARRSALSGRHGEILPLLMAATVLLAVTREGAEILVYVSGFWEVSDFLSAVGVGSLIGAGIGLSVGVLVYFLLVALPSKRALAAYGVLLLLIAAGMALQATALLIQADWITVSGAIWNTSAILPEDSLLGQLLYAFIGYEASPSATEVIVYVSSMAVVAVAFVAGRSRVGSGDGDTA
jgi:high-affinity iron transporter